ncbi:MAG: recombinase family protein [Lachnospiraceae bacterium]|nr:recombinase family protein [Lachnospiraceae bacterium]
MNAGYVRLSRDDDKRNYSSIENQKLIITQYAKERNLNIDCWYEDDGISGYIFERPGFIQLMHDLKKDIDTVFVKDFSRLGRHNAKILLLLDEFKEMGKHLIVIDDHYDSKLSDDDIIGITTWFNERYVKDTSKKIRQALGARQKNGTLITQPPFGYKKSDQSNTILEIVPKEAKIIRQIYDLYIQGLGYRKISIYLTEEKIPTPSMIRREWELKRGRNTNRKISNTWSDSMVKYILDNDYYIGTLRLGKRARQTIHGKDKRVPKEEQYIFENHHPPIIDKMTFDLVQELKATRNRSHYKGNHGAWTGSQVPSLFGSCLYCKDCGSKLTPIRRQTSAGIRKYYICSTYNSKGKRYCLKSHLIKESDLTKDIIAYIQLCRNIFYKDIISYNMEIFHISKKITSQTCSNIQEEIDETKKHLKTLLSQKAKDLSINPENINPENQTLIAESYDSIQQELMTKIHTLEKKLDSQKIQESKISKVQPTALDIIDHLISEGTLNRTDIEFLIDRIEVDENGLPEIKLKAKLP